MEGSYVADYLIGADRKIPDWPIKITFLGEIVTAIKLGIKSCFIDVELSTSDAISGPGFVFFFQIPTFVIRLSG